MNIYDLSRKTPGEEQVDVLFSGAAIRIERIISTGETSDWYVQTEDEWILLIEGSADLEVVTASGSETIALQRGDSLFLPSHQKHRVTSTSVDPACVWLCVFGQFNDPRK